MGRKRRKNEPPQLRFLYSPYTKRSPPSPVLATDRQPSVARREVPDSRWIQHDFALTDGGQPSSANKSANSARQGAAGSSNQGAGDRKVFATQINSTGRPSLPAEHQRPVSKPPQQQKQQASIDPRQLQSLKITVQQSKSTVQQQQQQQQAKSSQPVASKKASASSPTDLLTVARSLIQPRGTERSYFWRLVAEQAGTPAPPSQFESLEAVLLAEGSLRIEDILGRLMYYPNDSATAAGAAADLNSPVLIPMPRTPTASHDAASPAAASTAAEAVEFDEWGFAVAGNGDNGDSGDACAADEFLGEDQSEAADYDEDDGSDEEEDSDAFLDVAGLVEGQQFSALCFGSDSEGGVWIYTLDSQLEAELEQVMKEVTVLLRYLRTRVPPLYAQYCLATMPEEILDQPLLLLEPEDSNELLRCRLASKDVSEAAVKIQLIDKDGAPIKVPMIRLRRLPPQLIAELQSNRHGGNSAQVGQVAAQTLDSLNRMPDAVVRVDCCNPPPTSLSPAASPELMRFSVESASPKLLIRRLIE